ncbi:hypothetical protein H4S03_001088 [Coemansia sp. S3946]|nr:hypothetical protein H4S03_001088 [Coemansia sp. S3946]
MSKQSTRTPTHPPTLDERIRARFSPGAIYHSPRKLMDTIYERRMREMSSTIRSKPGWIEALNSKETCLSWSVEAKAKELTDVEFCYVLDELHYYKSLSHQAAISDSVRLMAYDNGTITIKSYINNLHPVKHAALYPIITSIFSKFLPLLEQVVTDLVHPRKPGVELNLYECYEHERPEPEPKSGRWAYLEYLDELQAWKEDASYVDPQPKPFVVPKRPISPYRLRGRVELTPEAPSYSSKDWSVVGLANERIIGTGVYFYDMANIAPCSLTFREALRAKHYPSDSFEYYAMCFANGLNIEYGDGAHDVSQELGDVDIYNKQCVVFPNTIQYQMSELALDDATKPGHCKMLTFYFVDPSTCIPSTEIVPPQQKDWWTEDILSSEPFRSLPLLVMDGIMD